MIPHNRLSISNLEKKAAVDVLETGYLSQGDQVSSFENELCDFLNIDRGHAVAVSSGSAALFFAIMALGDIYGCDSVAIPAYSCSALRNAVLLADKEVQYADVETNTPNIDLQSDVISKSDTTIACHMYGMPSKIANNLIIEDCAQALGAIIDGVHVGTQTLISTFSFYATKLITTGGEGGAIVSTDKCIIDFLKDLRKFDMIIDDKRRFNFHMTELQAAIGRVQLSRFPDLLKRRRDLADRYIDNGINIWRKQGGIDYRGLIFSCDNYQLIDYLNKNNICAICPITSEELLCDEEKVPNAYELTQRLVSIPLYPSLDFEEQDYVIKVLKEYISIKGML